MERSNLYNLVSKIANFLGDREISKKMNISLYSNMIQCIGDLTHVAANEYSVFSPKELEELGGIDSPVVQRILTEKKWQIAAKNKLIKGYLTDGETFLKNQPNEIKDVLFPLMKEVVILCNKVGIEQVGVGIGQKFTDGHAMKSFRKTAKVRETNKTNEHNIVYSESLGVTVDGKLKLEPRCSVYGYDETATKSRKDYEKDDALQKDVKPDSTQQVNQPIETNIDIQTEQKNNNSQLIDEKAKMREDLKKRQQNFAKHLKKVDSYKEILNIEHIMLDEEKLTENEETILRRWNIAKQISKNSERER